ncbi:MAG: adenylate/guanylate cyclase domain-containing protein [Syntrophorhabdaceae bacterium]|nr:adenylate/guanylate cyclase domain-containing protein [Syntrophorhabdaceae bacterium]
MPKKKRRVRNIVLLASVSFAISLVLFLFDVLAPYENRSFDLFSQYLNPARASDRIVIIEIDQQSIDALSLESINWPWPRQVYAPIIEFASLADAFLVDILFTEPSSYGQEDDMVLGDAVAKASNVYLPFFLSRNEKTVGPEDMAYLRRFAIAGGPPSGPAYRSVTTPIDVIRHGAGGSGNVAINPDGDGVYRRIPLAFTMGDMALPNLALSWFTGRGMVKMDSGRILFRNRPLPLTDGKLLLRFPSGRKPFTVIPAIDILSAYRDTGKGQSKTLSPSFFKGKVVFLGMTAPGLLDLKSTPTMPVSTGVHVNATVFENLDLGTFMRPVSGPFVALFMLLVSLFIAAFVLTFHTIAKNLSAFAASSILILGIAAALFSRQYYLPTTYLMVTLILGFILSAAFSYALEGRERQFIKRTFSQYMDKTIVEHVLQNPDIVKPGGKKARVTVLFADIAGFTTISERNSPEDTALMLHRVLNELTEVVIEEKGVVDKYIGDCIMAFWGAPLETPNDEINACRCSLKFIEAIGTINGIFERDGISPVAIRVGLHTGEAIAGNMGSVRLFDFTVVGDTVNLASRLESVNKVFGTSIIVSEHTLAKTYGLFASRSLGPIEVKGKSEPVVIHEVICENDNVPPAVRKKIDLYDEALRVYREQRFSEAVELFNALLAEFPHDGPSEFYKKRAEAMAGDFSLTNNWDIIRMTEK